MKLKKLYKKYENLFYVGSIILVMTLGIAAGLALEDKLTKLDPPCKFNTYTGKLHCPIDDRQERRGLI